MSFGLVLAGCAVEQPGSDSAADEAALRALAAAALEAEVNEDLEAWLATVADDAILLTDDGVVRGKGALRERFMSSFANFDWEGSWSLEEIEISGDLAVMWGPIETILIARDGSSHSHTAGHHFDSARRQSDGSWKYTWWTLKVREIPEIDQK